MPVTRPVMQRAAKRHAAPQQTFLTKEQRVGICVGSKREAADAVQRETREAVARAL